MENKEIRIFTSDIEVPAVVQKKADAAFAQIKKERAEAMKTKRDEKIKPEQGKMTKYIKPIIAAAACVALITGVGVSNYVGKDYNNPVVKENGGDNDKSALDSLVQGNMFTMTAYAKELEPGKPVPLTTDVGNSGRASVFSGDEDGSVSYCINTEFLCQGENIERVGYSINHGAFQVIQPINSDDRIIVDGQIYNGELNTGSIGGGYDETLEEQPELYETTLYQSFTLDYDKQSAENTWINICNECPDNGEILDLMWGEANTLEEENDGINKLLDNTVITCTVYYADGTSQSVDIGVSSRVMTYEEAGEPCGKDDIPGVTKSTFITFEVK
ncbi:MAG: hypothetical protein J6K48_13565 [Lachnospiraceae bacterium]|nr:hypothetical protein [Lachnospiraceae bacterium]